jgi:Domain of unknown function (DUF4267)
MTDSVAKASSPWRSVGVWMAVLIALLMALNTWRAASNPAAFVRYFGIEAAADAHPAFVYVYASRAFFLGAITAVLLWKRQFAGLALFAGVAILMPIADAILVAWSGGNSAIVARHLATALYLAVTAFLLHRWNARRD